MTALGRAVLYTVLLTGCQTMDEVPAVLTATSEAEAASVIADALDRPSVMLGEPDPREASEVVVLPPRPGTYETRSIAMPRVYDLVLTGGACILVAREGGERFSLREGACRPA